MLSTWLLLSFLHPTCIYLRAKFPCTINLSLAWSLAYDFNDTEWNETFLHSRSHVFVKSLDIPAECLWLSLRFVPCLKFVEAQG